MASTRRRIGSKSGEDWSSFVVTAFCDLAQARERSPVTSSSQRYGSSLEEAAAREEREARVSRAARRCGRIVFTIQLVFSFQYSVLSRKSMLTGKWLVGTLLTGGIF